MSYEYNVLTHVEQCIMVTIICFTGESTVFLHKCTHRASEQVYAFTNMLRRTIGDGKDRTIHVSCVVSIILGHLLLSVTHIPKPPFADTTHPTSPTSPQLLDVAQTETQMLPVPPAPDTVRET
jgi:hypothetical protein